MSKELDKILIRDISRLYEDSDDCNVQIQVGHGSNVRVFKAHSVILRARSSYFRAALSSNWAKKDGDYMILHQPNISPIVFEIILRYNSQISIKNFVPYFFINLFIFFLLI